MPFQLVLGVMVEVPSSLLVRAAESVSSLRELTVSLLPSTSDALASSWLPFCHAPTAEFLSPRRLLLPAGRGSSGPAWSPALRGARILARGSGSSGALGRRRVWISPLAADWLAGAGRPRSWLCRPTAFRCRASTSCRNPALRLGVSEGARS